MEQVRIRDNSRVTAETLHPVDQLVGRIVDKTLKELEGEGVFVFPERVKGSEDLGEDQTILERKGKEYRAGNVMGFLGYGEERLVICSRFAGAGEDYLTPYLLNQVLGCPNLVDLETESSQEKEMVRWLMLLFPRYLRSAARKGLFKTYIRRNYNDDRVRGVIDVPRHIRENTPFLGRVAYGRREHSTDNPLMELVRHTVEYIGKKPYGRALLGGVKEEVQRVIDATPGYAPRERGRVIRENRKHTVRHAYFREYRSLQRLCLMILQHREYRLGAAGGRVFGVLFDGAWLWEEYVNTLVGDAFYHPRNKAGEGAQSLFDGGRGRVFPDFISRAAEGRVIADAKYKPVGNIGRDDYQQLLAYMLRFDAKRGYFLYPDDQGTGDVRLRLNRGTSYEDNVAPREDIAIIKHGLPIPVDAEDYADFAKKMAVHERAFWEGLGEKE